MPKRKYRKYTKKEKARYYAAKRLRRAFYNVSDPEDANMRWNMVGPNRYQRAAGKGTATANQMALRKAIGYYGEGDYRKWLKYGSRAIGAGLGAATGYATGGWGGAYGGAKSGWGAGAKFSKTMGWGDYTTPMITNQIVDGKPGVSSDTPVMLNHMGDLSGDIILQHREFIKNITVAEMPEGVTSSPLEKTELELNPGLKSTFPFLSQIANNFELYEFQGLAFQFVPHYGEGEDSILGKVIMVTNYDPDARTFRNSQEMQNYDYACTAKPSLGQLHGVETASHKRATDLMYVRDKTVTRDKAFTDIGKFTIATEGIPKAGNIGELWVSYKVRLSRAHLNDIYREGRYDEAVVKLSAATTYTYAKSENITDISISSSDKVDVTFNTEEDEEYLVTIAYCRETAGTSTSYQTHTVSGGEKVEGKWCKSAATTVVHGDGTLNWCQNFFVKATSTSVSIQMDNTSPIWNSGEVWVTVRIMRVPHLHPLLS